MDIDKRLEGLTQSVELLATIQKDTEKHLQSLAENVETMSKVVAKHEQWQEKVSRTFIAGLEAALREWRNGDEA